MTAYLAAGAISGIAGLIVFLVIHHFWIQPIWFIAPIGLVLAVLGGLAVGWAFEALAPRLPQGMWSAPALVLLIVAILLPAIVLAQVRRPMFEFTPEGGRMMIGAGQAALVFILELPLTAAIAGGLAGWWIAGTREAALRTALAGVVFALGPGHNIPLISGSWPAVIKSWILLGAIIAAAALTLVGVHALLVKRGF